MSEDNKIEDQLELTTSNVEEVTTSTEVVEAKEVESTEPKSVTLDEALAKAFEKHVPEKSDEKPKTALPKTATTEEAPAEEVKNIDPITGRAIEPMKPPAGWTPALREKWGSVDPQIQKFIRDQEVGTAKKLQEVSEERKIGNDFKEVVAPYEAMLRSFNTTAKDHVKELMNMSHTLNTGSAQTRAQVIYNLIQHFKPDPQALQSLFAGQQPAQPQAPTLNVQEEVQKVLAAREEEAQSKGIASDIERFSADPNNEFFADVRDVMGKIIQAGIVDAPTMPELFRKAYDLACSQHPEISQIIAGRGQTQVQPTPSPAAVRSVKPSLSSGNKSKTAVRSVSLNDAVHEGMRRAGLM